MKRQKITILSFMCMLLFSGCRDFFKTENILEENDFIEKLEESKAYINVSIPDWGGLKRTALPKFDSESVNNFIFALSGNLTSESTEEVLGSFESLSDLSNASIPCEEGSWNFTLTASKDGTVFTGSLSNIQIKAGENNLAFSLTWNRNALEGKGSLSFALDFSEAENAGDVKLVTGELLSYNTTSGEERELSGYEEKNLTVSNGKVIFNETEIPAGNYRVKINLYADTEKKNPINSWRELVIITGAQTSYANRKFSALNKVYSITYELNGGSEINAAAVPRIFTRNTAAFSLPAPTRKGYAFAGWFKDANFGTEAIQITKGSTGDKKYYAKWLQVAITVSIEDVDDLSISYEEDGTEITFTASGGSEYIWNVNGVRQSGNGASFVLDVSPLGDGVHEVEAISGDLSSMITVAVDAGRKNFYVSANGDDSNDGTSKSKALATIAAAVNKMNDSNLDYTIFIDGMLGRSTGDRTDVAFGQFIADVEVLEYEENGNSKWKYVHKQESIQANSITVSGLHPLENGEPVDGIDPEFDPSTNGKSTPLLLVATPVPVVIKNIKLTGGYNKSGEALVIGTSYLVENESEYVTSNVTIKDGTLIIDNNKGTAQLSTEGYGPVVRIDKGSVCKMEGGNIRDNIAGAGLVSVVRGATFEMTGGSISENTLHIDSDSTRSFSCGVYIAAPAGDGSLPGGLFKISDDAVVDEVYLNTGAVVTFAGTLSSEDDISIIPKEYIEGTSIVEVTSDSGLNISDVYGKLALKQKEDGSFWQILNDGTLFEGYISSSTDLGSILSPLVENTSDTPFRVTLTDNSTSFSTILSNLNSALSANAKYIDLHFKNAAFTKIEGDFSEFVINLSIPASVTSVGFIDGKGLGNFDVDSANTSFSVDGNILYSKSGTTLYRYPPAKEGSSVTIGTGITSIADGAFANCLNIENFVVASGNTAYKVISGNLVNSASTYNAYAQVSYFKRNTNIPDPPDKSSDEYMDWYDTYRNSLNGQRDYGGYVPIGVLTSYDGKTLVACPSGFNYVTKEDLDAEYGTKDQTGSTVTNKVDAFKFNFEHIKPYAFSGCTKLKSAEITISEDSAPAYMFKDCNAITSITLNHTEQDVIAYTFTNCTSLSYVYLSSTINKVKTNALYGCTGLTYIKFWGVSPDSVNSAVEANAYPSTCTVELSGVTN